MLTAAALEYKQQARVFWEQAQEELANGDLLQASEKGWGAAAQMVKAVAECRGLQHKSHRDLFKVISGLENDDLKVQFATANTLHTNFYEGWLDQVLVERYLESVGAFIQALDDTEFGDHSPSRA